jgi:hypothetical protein
LVVNKPSALLVVRVVGNMREEVLVAVEAQQAVVMLPPAGVQAQLTMEVRAAVEAAAHNE